MLFKQVVGLGKSATQGHLRLTGLLVQEKLKHLVVGPINLSIVGQMANGVFQFFKEIGGCREVVTVVESFCLHDSDGKSTNNN